MSFLRPELAEALVRRREALVWGAALALGLGLLWRGYARVEPLSFVVGIAVALAGFALLRGALARMRLAGAAAAPGVVVVDEGRIGLLGPAGGGFVDLPALVAADASSLYARNVLDFLKLIITKDGALHLDLQDDIVAACLMAHEGAVKRA